MFDKKPVYLFVGAGRQGLETVINPAITRLHDAYKSQLISFLITVIKALEHGRNNETIDRPGQNS